MHCCNVSIAITIIKTKLIRWTVRRKSVETEFFFSYQDIFIGQYIGRLNSHGPCGQKTAL